MTLLSKLRRARELDISHKHQIHTVGVGWNKPHEEWLKINVDAATFQDDYIGVGAVIRDSDGQFMRARCSRVAGNWQPREDEALSLK